MDALPQWTSKIDKRGLDPLGMQNAGVVLYQALLPGISNITLRMRYYGFFCWLSDAYARRGVTTDLEICSCSQPGSAAMAVMSGRPMVISRSRSSSEPCT